MDDEATQPATQQVLDPRRLGRNNSGLSEPDISDVLCILHPSSPAAFRIVKLTAERSPQHVLQNQGLLSSTRDSQPLSVEEQETFILGAGKHPENTATDLALRFSSRTVSPVMGFTFGRNPNSCDIVLDVDSVKRVSNVHFRIYVNNSGVVMLQDMSTNGTLVDRHVLKGKTSTEPATRMLNPGSIIQIVSANESEVIKFILKIPSRDGFMEQYTAKFLAYMQWVADAEKRQGDAAELLRRGRRGHLPQAALPLAGVAAGPASLKAPVITSNYTHGMVWDGGDEYNVTGLLGKGAFAMVYRLATAMEGKELAAKELEKKRFIKNGQLDQKLDNEMRIMKTLSHPNIVQYIDYRDEKNHLYIIMEYVPCGDLQEYLAINKVLSETNAKAVAAQILDALAYLHHKKITHRDIKPDNILIASEDPFIVKLSDFGLSKVVNHEETFLKTFCGTLLYCAPEVFPHFEGNAQKKGTKRRRGSSAKADYHAYSQSIDIWSFAAVLWYALCGSPPFEGVVDPTGRGMFDKIMDTRLNPQALFDKGVSPQAVDLLLKMLNTDPSKRPTELECLKHPWLADIVKKQPHYAQYSLNAITEEVEDQAAEDGPNVDLSQLSIHGKQRAGEHEDEDDEDSGQDDDTGDCAYDELRRSKRVRPDLLVPRNQIRSEEGMDSSPEISYHTSLVQDGASSFAPNTGTTANTRLFGEIGQSALQSSGLLGEHTNVALAMAQRDGTASSDRIESGRNPALPNFAQYSDVKYPDLPPTEELGGQFVHGAEAARSLLGAESMMRDITMGDSPQSANSPANEPPTPKTPDFSQASTGLGPGGVQDITPKPQVLSFDRKIRLSQSYVYDPEGTNSERSFNDSKSDFAGVTGSGSTNDEELPVNAPLATGLPATMHPSLTNLGTDGAADESSTPVGASVTSEGAEQKASQADAQVTDSSASAEFRRPPPRLGKLTSTSSSTGFKELPIILRLEQRMSVWGRDPSNTHVFPDPMNTQVPKKGIIIYFHAWGIEKVDREGGDITKMEGLHTIITTNSKVGIWVNGVKLKADAPPGKTNYGRLYTGDTIGVFKDTARGGARLEFECEFYHGEAANMRPEGETFKVEQTKQQQNKG